MITINRFASTTETLNVNSLVPAANEPSRSTQEPADLNSVTLQTWTKLNTIEKAALLEILGHRHKAASQLQESLAPILQRVGAEAGRPGPGSQYSLTE